MLKFVITDNDRRFLVVRDGVKLWVDEASRAKTFESKYAAKRFAKHIELNEYSVRPL